jgi:hypothetical protein
MYYYMLIVGIVLVLASVLSFIQIYLKKEYIFLSLGKAILALLLGILILIITLPSLKYMLLKEYDVVKGSCTIEIASSGRSSEATFHMLDTDEWFSFTQIPELDAYGKSIPYYCEATVTKDHKVEIGYKIFDINSRDLLTSD